MEYFTSILKGMNNTVPVSFTYTYETSDTAVGNADAYTYLKKVAKKECGDDFVEITIEHNSITLSKYEQIVNGIFEIEDVSDIDLNTITNEEQPEENP